LPGVDAVVIDRLPWIDAEPEPIRPNAFAASVATLRRLAIDEAIIFTSFHQSPLPTALMLRLAGIARIGAISEEYPGALLDVRHRVAPDLHEVERALSLACAMGYDPPASLCLALRSGFPHATFTAPAPYVVVHPGASVPARTLAPAAWRSAVRELSASGRNVVVTGSAAERRLVRHVTANTRARACVCSDLDELAGVVATADVLVSGNTGPAHLAAAVGTPVVSCFAPTVPSRQWHPWQVPHVLLGAQDISCRGCRARVCPRTSQHCLDVIRPADIVGAVAALERTSRVDSLPVAGVLG
jgi:ADP-heptose:LPS heptosyltransferase